MVRRYARQKPDPPHDFGSIVAAWCAVVRPDVFRSVSLMCAPFAGAPQLPFGTVDGASATGADPARIHSERAALQPPRKHYHWYYSTRGADDNMHYAALGIHAFLRAYFHYKSGDWPGNQPFALQAWRGEELAQLPTYYIRF